MPNTLTLAEVKHIAELAKLDLTDQEARMFQEQLSEILEYAAMLQQADTEGVSPTAQGLEASSSATERHGMREDRVTPSLTQEQALANAPARQDGQFKVQPILDE